LTKLDLTGVEAAEGVGVVLAIGVVVPSPAHPLVIMSDNIVNPNKINHQVLLFTGISPLLIRFYGYLHLYLFTSNL
jgi:hypothetical protein